MSFTVNLAAFFTSDGIHLARTEERDTSFAAADILISCM